MITDFERVQLLLLSALVGRGMAKSGAELRKAEAIGLEGLTQAQKLLEQAADTG